MFIKKIKVNLNFFVFAFLFLCSSLFAQKRITDFYSSEIQAEVPSSLISFGDHIYFLANDLEHGLELWRSDGTAENTGFFFETEPDTKENVFVPYATDSALYFFSKENAWVLRKTGFPTKLNTKPLKIQPKLSVLGEKLFFNMVEYIHLKTLRLGSILNEEFKLDTSQITNYQEQITENIRVVRQNIWSKELNAVLVASEKDTDKSVQLQLDNNFNWGVPGQFYKIRDAYFSVISMSGIYQFYTDRAPKKVEVMSGKIFNIEQKGDSIYIKMNQGGKIDQYVFDGKETKITRSLTHDYSDVLDLKPINIDSLYYVQVLKTYKIHHEIVRFNKNNQLETVYDLKNNFYGIAKVKAINKDFTAVYWEDTYPGYGLKDKSQTFLISKNKIDFDEANDVVWLNAKKQFYGIKSKTGTAISKSIYNFSEQKFLLQNTNNLRPRSMGFTANLDTKTVFLALNEKENGKSIYTLSPKSEKPQLVFSNKNASFEVLDWINEANTNVILEDISFYNSGQEANSTILNEYNRSTFGFTSFYFNHATQKATEILDQKYPQWIYGDKALYFNENQMVEKDLADQKLYKNYDFPFQKNKDRFWHFRDKIYFIGDKNSDFEGFLCAFDFKTKTTKLIVDQPVFEVFNYKDRPLVVLKNGKVVLVETKKQNTLYELLDLETNAFHRINFYALKKGGLIYLNQKEDSPTLIFYLEDDCQRSGLLDYKFSADQYWSSYGLKNGQYLLRSQDATLLCKGRKVVKTKLPFNVFIGESSNFAYFAYVNDDFPSTSPTLIYQFDYKKNSYKTIDQTLGYLNYNGPFLQELLPNMKWTFTAGADEFIIKHIKAGQDEITKTNLSSNGWVQYILKKNDSTLFYKDNTLVSRISGQEKPIYRFLENEYWGFTPLESDRYVYIPIINNRKIIKFLRVKRSDFSTVVIPVPFGIRNVRTRSDVSDFYQVYLVGNTLFGLIESPKEGVQLYALDQAEQEATKWSWTTPMPEIEDLKLSNRCFYTKEDQLIFTDAPPQYGVFPNPTTGYINVYLAENELKAITSIKIIDTNGKIVSDDLPKNNFDIQTKYLSLNLPYLASGIYFLNIEIAAKTMNIKFMIE